MTNRPGYNVTFTQISDEQLNVNILSSVTNINYRIYVDGLNLRIVTNDPKTIEAVDGNNGDIYIKLKHPGTAT